MGVNAYDRLVERLGEDGAREEMRKRRGMVKNHKGGGFRDPKVAKEASKLGVIARNGKKEGKIRTEEVN